MSKLVGTAPTLTPQSIDLNCETTWDELYPSLRVLARYLVYSFHVSLWHGQEEDIIEDIVQETALRVIERARKTERGEAPPIYSLKHMATAIAQNYCRDLRRSDRKLFHFPEQDDGAIAMGGMQEQTHVLDAVVEQMYQEWILVTVARKIANFPEKQREAILIDLANRMSYGRHPTPLQKAFMEIGI